MLRIHKLRQGALRAYEKHIVKRRAGSCLLPPKVASLPDPQRGGVQQRGALPQRRASRTAAAWLVAVGLSALGCERPQEGSMASSATLRLALRDADVHRSTPGDSNPLAHEEITRARKRPRPSSHPEGTAWCFHAGAPLSGPPALLDNGELRLATVEGYVHALNADGGFRWSYTLKGGALGSLVVRDSGATLVATNRSRIYALRDNGRLLWVYRAPTPIATGLAISPRGSLLFTTHAPALYTMTLRGGVIWRSPLSARPTTPPVALGQGRAVVGTEQGVTWSAGPSLIRDLPLPAAPSAVWPLGELSMRVYSAQRLSAQDDAGGVAWALASVSAAASAGEGSLVVQEGRALALDAEGKAVLQRTFEGEASAAPARWADSLVQPLGDGRLLLLEPGGVSFLANLEVGSLGTPLIDVARRRAIAWAGDGRVCAVPLSGPGG